MQDNTNFQQGVGDDFWPEDDIPSGSRVCPPGMIMWKIKKLYRQDSSSGKLMYRGEFEAVQPVQIAGCTHNENYVLVDQQEFEAANREGRDQNIVPYAVGTKILQNIFRAAQVPPANSLAVKCKGAEGAMFMAPTSNYKEPWTTPEGKAITLTKSKLVGYFKVGAQEPVLYDVKEDDSDEYTNAAPSATSKGGNGPSDTLNVAPSAPSVTAASESPSVSAPPPVTAVDDDPVVECQVCGQWKGKMSEAEDHIANCNGAVGTAA